MPMVISTVTIGLAENTILKTLQVMSTDSRILVYEIHELLETEKKKEKTKTRKTEWTKQRTKTVTQYSENLSETEKKWRKHPGNERNNR